MYIFSYKILKLIVFNATINMTVNEKGCDTMARINCPECGRIISDLQARCEYCGFPIGQFTDPAMSESDEISYAVLNETKDEDITRPAVPSRAAETVPPVIPEEAVKKACQPSAPESGEKKKRGIYGAIAVCAFAAALCVGVGVCFALTNHGNDSISVPVSYEPVVTEPSEPAELNVEQVDIVSASKKGDSFIVSFDSDEEEPFVVVFSDDESEKNSVSGTRQYYYAYMNEGYGEQEIKNAAAGSGVVNKDMFRIEGYLKGEAVGNDFVPEIIVNTDYEEVPFEDSALVTVVINMDLGQKKNGRLFYSVDLADYSFSYNSYVQSACVVDGKTEQQVVAINVPPGTTDSSVYVGVDVLYFVESENTEEEPVPLDITTERYMVEAEENVYYLEHSFTAELASEQASKGEVLYQWVIVQDTDEIKDGYGSIPAGDSSGTVSLSETVSVKTDNANGQAKGYIKNAGFIPWNQVKKSAEVT